MSKVLQSILIGGASLTVASLFAFAAQITPTKFVAIDQNIDQATLSRMHYTDQGTRLLPAAWLAALDKADGSGKFMNTDDLQRFGFLVDNVAVDKLNPYGWPIGFTVSDPKTSGGVSIAGVNCAFCHTGQLEYKGTAVRIEGGKRMFDQDDFFNSLGKALTATAKDPARRTKFFAEAIRAGYPADRMEAEFAGFVGTSNPFASGITSVEDGPGRGDAIQGIANSVAGKALMVPANYRNRDAPVSTPYLWDIWRLSWVEYDGMLARTSTTSRNIFQVLGVFGQTNIVNPKTGELNLEPLRWQTSIQLDNLVWLEKTLARLRAPTWPADIFGPIDQTKAERGRALFTSNCAGCHGIKTLPDGSWDVTVIPLQRIGTDPNHATNWASRTYDLSKLGLSKETPGVEALDAVTNAVRKQLYADNRTPTAEQDGDLHLEAPCGYKARPLIGIWATPPYLHNGSVRTVFDLLSDTRPTKFSVGVREYDPVNLGYMEDPNPRPFVFDTSIGGNSNAGHWWTDDTARPGRIGPKLADADKYAIIEFLKTATYDNYPSEKRDHAAIMPCQGQQNWALKK